MGHAIEVQLRTSASELLQTQVNKRTLGNCSLKVSALRLGYMGLRHGDRPATNTQPAGALIEHS